MSPDQLGFLRRATLTTDDPAGDTAADTQDTTEAPTERAGWKRHPAWRYALTTLACLLVLFALVAPNEFDQFSVASFLRIPAEALVGAALLLVLPPRPRRIVAIVLGVILGLLTIVKLLDVGFFIALSRPFDPVGDWAFFGPGFNFLVGAVGQVGAVVAVILVVIVAIGLVLLMGLAVGRLARIAARRRVAVTRTTAVLAVVWLVCAFTGVQFATGQPFAARTAATLAYDDVRQVGIDIRDQRQFNRQLATDPVNSIPPGDLLTGLRGKNVLLVFVESYGRVAVQDSGFSPPIDALLDNGTRQLAAAGFQARSAFLTSSTVGGASWLAHSTVQSGLFVNSQQRYDELLAANRTSLSGAFKKAGWRIVGDDPANFDPLPKSTLYDYDKFYNETNVGYHGPRFSYATIPDQFTFNAFQHDELDKPGHQPVMAEIDLVSSHSPWAPLPRMVPWRQLGDGSIFDPMVHEGTQPRQILSSAAKLQVAYGQSIQYSLTALIDYLKLYGDQNTVMIFLGDHQPAPIITGQGATHDVPTVVVAKDPKVINAISSWGWDPGLRPGRDAPVWLMSTFRQRFLNAFDTRPTH